jgi:Fe-S-cluster containining protein
MKAQARTWLWWPSLDSSIEQYCKSCLPCLQTRQDPPRTNPTPWPEAKTPYERVHIDYLGPIRHKMYLIITCAYSKWPEVYQVNSLRADELEEKLRACFARWGISKLLVSDNGRSLVAPPTEEFLRRNKIEHRTSPPFHPQSNGAAENSVKTSAKLLIGTDLRTRLSFLKEGKDDQREIERVKSENAQKLHRRFKVGDVVMARDCRTINKRTWTEAKIIKQLGRTTYICRTKSGEDWKRHANQLIHTTLKADIPEVTETKSSPSRITTSKIARNSVTPSTFQVQEQPILTPDPQPTEPLIHESPSPRPVRVRKPPPRLNITSNK